MGHHTTAALAVSLLILVIVPYAFALTLPPHPDIHLSGEGRQTFGPYDIAEGTLEFHIQHTTQKINAYMAVSLETDSDLDGEFCDSSDQGCFNVWHGAYETLNNLDIYTNYSSFLMGGKARIVVEAPGAYQIDVRQYPWPRHAINGVVQEVLVKEGRAYPDIITFSGNANVTVTDGLGNTQSQITNYVGDYSFTVFGYTNYTLTASSPGHRSRSTRVDGQNFIVGGRNPGWALDVGFTLPAGGAGASLYCAVKDKETGRAVAGALVNIIDKEGNAVSHTTTDQDGRCAFTGLEEQTYTLIASAGGYATSSAQGTASSGSSVEQVWLALPPASQATDLSLVFDTASIVISTNSSDALTVTVRNKKQAGSLATAFRLEHPGLRVQMPSSCSRKGTEEAIGCKVPALPGGGQATYSFTVSGPQAGTFGIDAFVASDGDEHPDDNEAGATVSVSDTLLWGKVFTLDEKNQPVFLARVKVTAKTGTEEKIAYTDESGIYRIGGIGTQPYILRVALTDKQGIVAIHSKKGFGGSVASLQTKERTPTPGTMRQDIAFLPSSADWSPAITADQRAVLRDAAVYYYHTMEAVRFAQKSLGLTFNHLLPVDIMLYDDQCGACYSKADSSISVAATKDRSSIRSRDMPDNRDYHEFGHHVQADSLIGGENIYPDRLPGDVNHMGVENSDSRDSFIEGFAEFFSLMVKQSHLYRWAGMLTNLEGNNHVTVQGGVKMPDEEFQVASLLWDLVDSQNEPGDLFSLGEKRTFELISTPDVVTVHSLYLVLNKTLGAQDSTPNDSVSDLDELFIIHGFYYDANQNHTYQRGEPPGYADSFAASQHGKRSEREPAPGTALQVSVADIPPGQDVPVRVEVIYDGVREGLSYAYNDLTRGGTIYLMPPGDAREIRVTPIIPGRRVQTYAITADQFYTRVAAAQEVGSDSFDSHAFTVSEDGPAAPEPFTALWQDDEHVRLRWKAGGDVAVVKAYDGFPASPDEGIVVFDGDARGAMVEELSAGELPVYYSAFTRDGTAYSLPAHAQPALAQQPGQPGWMRWVLPLLALLLVVSIVRRRRASHREQRGH